jgi:hypothetical protein
LAGSTGSNGAFWSNPAFKLCKDTPLASHDGSTRRRRRRTAIVSSGRKRKTTVVKNTSWGQPSPRWSRTFSRFVEPKVCQRLQQEVPERLITYFPFIWDGPYTKWRLQKFAVPRERLYRAVTYQLYGDTHTHRLSFHKARTALKITFFYLFIANLQSTP